MKVRVKDFPVRYKDTRYKKGDELNIAQDAFNDELFVCLDKQKDEKATDNTESETEDEE
ncbi:conjugal transfer protein [Lactiplantibacillus paraplantarum]|uniref:conjugal transfer protein n=1 Tax=Lactiplantibacillus paraplantarum TaxID=60520 RepID=UPI003DA33FD2